MGSHRMGILLLCALGAGLLGCGGKTTTEPQPSERVNDNKPNANARISSQTVFGDAGKLTSLFYVRRADDGSQSFRGRSNSVTGVGQLSPTGSLRWFQRMGYDPRGVASLPGSSAVPYGLVAVGAFDSNGDGDSEVGFASLFTSSGSGQNQITVASDSSDVWLNRIATVNDSTFIACGAERRSAVKHPLLALLHLRAPGVLSLGKTVVLQALTAEFFDVVVLPSPAAELAIAVASSNGASRSIHGLRAPWPALDAVAVEWSNEILSPAGPTIDVRDLEVGGGNLYVVGSLDDNGKTAPTTGGFWRSRFAASYSGAGVPRWFKVVALTKQSEGFYSIAVGSDAAYAVGYGANYQLTTDTKEVFGYGLISKLDLTTGAVLESFTLGSERYESGLNTASLVAGNLICGGWTEQETSGGPYRGWFSTVDVTSVGLTIDFPTPAAARVDRSPEPRRERDRDLH